MKLWILKSIAILLGIFAGLLLANAQGPKTALPSTPITKESKPKPAPVISDKIRGDFFKAQAEAQQAQTALEQARQTAQTMIDVFQGKLKEAQMACGPDHQLSQDQKRELVCVDKPKPAESAKK